MKFQVEIMGGIRTLTVNSDHSDNPFQATHTKTMELIHRLRFLRHDHIEKVIIHDIGPEDDPPFQHSDEDFKAIYGDLWLNMKYQPYLDVEILRFLKLTDVVKDGVYRIYFFDTGIKLTEKIE